MGAGVDAADLGRVHSAAAGHFELVGARERRRVHRHPSEQMEVQSQLADVLCCLVDGERAGLGGCCRRVGGRVVWVPYIGCVMVDGSTARRGGDEAANAKARGTVSVPSAALVGALRPR